MEQQKTDTANAQARKDEGGDLDEKIAKAFFEDGEPAAQGEDKAAVEQDGGDAKKEAVAEAQDDAGQPDGDGSAGQDEGDGSADGSEAGGEQKAQPEDADEDISELLDESGAVDVDKLKKLAKSAKHAQKLIGQTAKDREKIKKLPELEQQAAFLSQLRERVKQDPELQEALRRSDARARGLPVPQAQAPAKSQDEVAPENVDEEVRKAMAKGEYKRAVSLAMRSDPEFREFQKTRQQLEAETMERRKRDEEARVQSELSTFKTKYNGVLFGDGADTELYEAWREEVNDNRTYEESLAVAAFKLGRLPAAAAQKNTKPVQGAGAKAQALGAGRGAKPTIPLSKSKQKDEVWEGFNPKTFKEALNG